MGDLFYNQQQKKVFVFLLADDKLVKESSEASCLLVSMKALGAQSHQYVNIFPMTAMTKCSVSRDYIAHISHTFSL